MTVIERWECPEHGNAFAPVMTADETPRCGRRACGKQIVKVNYVPEARLAGAVSRLERVGKLAAWIERDKRESDKVLMYAQELAQLAVGYGKR